MTEFMLRQSERADYKRCRWRWNLSYNRQLQPKVSATPLRFGSLVHEALAVFYKPGRERGPAPAVTFAKLYDDEVAALGDIFPFKDEDGDWQDARELGIAMLTHYLEHHGLDGTIEVIAPEVPFQIPIHETGSDGRPDKNKHLVTAVGTFDAIIRKIDTGRLYLFEHKTAKSIQTKHLQLDEQANTYWALAGPWLRKQGLLDKGQEISGILYNFLRKAKPDARSQDEHGLYLNKDGSVSKSQPPPYFERVMVYRDAADRQNLVNRLRAEAWEISRVRDGDLPIYKTPTRDCSWDCSFYSVCELHEAGADWESMLGLTYEPWEPYQDHKER